MSGQDVKINWTKPSAQSVIGAVAILCWTTQTTAATDYAMHVGPTTYNIALPTRANHEMNSLQVLRRLPAFGSGSELQTTLLGDRLRLIRKRIVDSGAPLLSWAEIDAQVAEHRQGI